MNVRSLKRKSETDWARIDQMTDDDIDTSDIPPLDDAFFSRAKKLLPRLYVDRLDFLQARKFAAYIIKQRLHEERKTKRARENQQLIHMAFNTSLIISYSRPFTAHKDLEGKFVRNDKGIAGAPLKEHVTEVLKEADAIELHDRVLKLRNTAYAHSDSRSHLFERLDYTKQLPLMKVVLNLNQLQTARLKIMIGKWLKYLDEQIPPLKRR
jgi:hypothetical protein